jgi:hypothetical protein
MATFHESSPSISDEQFIDNNQTIAAVIVAACTVGILSILLVAVIFGT